MYFAIVYEYSLCVMYYIWVLSDQSICVLASKAGMLCVWTWTKFLECFIFVLTLHIHCCSNFQMYNILGQIFMMMGNFCLNFNHFLINKIVPHFGARFCFCFRRFIQYLQNCSYTFLLLEARAIPVTKYSAI